LEYVVHEFTLTREKKKRGANDRAGRGGTRFMARPYAAFQLVVFGGATIGNPINKKKKDEGATLYGRDRKRRRGSAFGHRKNQAIGVQHYALAT